MQDILLRVETATDPDDVFTEDEWLFENNELFINTIVIPILAMGMVS